jgi:hypothetical protein
MSEVPIPDVTVVVVTYNAAQRIGACLDALRDQELADLTLEVVVVDNASHDGTADLVARHHPEVHLVCSPVNTGFAGGNNLGLRTVRSPWVLLLNDDAVAEPDLVSRLVAAATRAPGAVAAVNATVLLAARFRPARPEDAEDAEDAEDLIVHGAHGDWVADPEGEVTLVNSTGNLVRTDGYGLDRGWLEDRRTHQPPRDVFGFCGAAVLLRRSALDTVGHFDDDFFMYYEDTDLSWRLRLAGYRVEHCADAVVHHEHAASSREGSELFRFHDARNRLLMLLKDATPGLAARALARFVITTASIAVRRSQPAAHVRTRVRVLVSYARLAPRMLARRRAVTRSAALARADVERLLVPPAASAPGAYRRGSSD